MFFFSVLAALIKFNSAYIHPIEQAFFRNFISIFLLLPFFFKKNFWCPKKENFKLLFLRCFFGGITMILLFWSYSLIPLSQAMAISFSTPLFIYFGGVLFFGEKINTRMTFYTLLGFILTIIIIRPNTDLDLGALLALVAAITHAIAGLIVKKLSLSENVFTLMFSMVCLMAPITLLPSIFVWQTPDSYLVYFILLLIGIFATLGNFCWTKSISLTKLTNIMPFDFTKLLFSTTIGLFFFNEKIDSITIICGTSLIICNTLMVKNVNKRKYEKNILPNN